MTLQELFNIGWQKFVVEKQPPSLSSDGSRCMYRGPNGARCLIGWVIPDDEYQPWFDERSLTGVCVIGPQIPALAGIGLEAARLLQVCHDIAASLTRDGAGDFHERIEDELRGAASSLSLTIPA